MKSGIEYFPLDVALDGKMELIEAEFGLTGFGVVVKLLGEIYGKQGYYIEWTTEVALLFARKVGLGGSVVSEIVEASIRRGMFNQEIFDKYRILTSRGIQKRYFEAVSRRKEIEVDESILLVNVAHLCKNVDIKRKNVNISTENADISKQSKVEKSKVKNTRDTDAAASSQTKAVKDFVPPTLDEVIAYCLERKNGVDPKRFFDYYEAAGWRDSKGKLIRSWKQKMIMWEKHDNAQPPSNTVKFGGDNYEPIH